jgi:hypothetical protein
MVNEPVVFKKGFGAIKIIRWEPEKRIINVQTANPGQILVKTFYCPRWKAYINGTLIPIAPDPLTGLIDLEIPPGEYDIHLRFEASIYSIAGRVISTISAGIIFFLLLRKRALSGTSRSYKVTLLSG